MLLPFFVPTGIADSDAFHMLDTLEKGHYFVNSLLVRILRQCHRQLRWQALHDVEPVQSQLEEAGLCELHICVSEVLGEGGKNGQWLAYSHGANPFTRGARVRRICAANLGPIVTSMEVGIRQAVVEEATMLAALQRRTALFAHASIFPRDAPQPTL